MWWRFSTKYLGALYTHSSNYLLVSNFLLRASISETASALFGLMIFFSVLLSCSPFSNPDDEDEQRILGSQNRELKERISWMIQGLMEVVTGEILGRPVGRRNWRKRIKKRKKEKKKEVAGYKPTAVRMMMQKKQHDGDNTTYLQGLEYFRIE